MTAVMGTTFGDPAPRRGVLAPPTADARVAPVEHDDAETTVDEEVDSKPKRTRRQRPPAKRSDR